MSPSRQSFNPRPRVSPNCAFIAAKTDPNLTNSTKTARSLFVKLDNYGRHIICSCGIRSLFCTDLVEELLYHWAQVLGLRVYTFDVPIDFLDTLFVGHAVPDTVARHNNIIVILVPVPLRNIWHRRHSLLLCWQIWTILELVVAEGAAQGQLAVHAVHHHRMTCCLNAFGFLRVLGFVVEAEWVGIVATLTDDGATVTCIRAVNMRLVYKDHAGRAASVVRICITFYLFVQQHECFLECVFIVALL